MPQSKPRRIRIYQPVTLLLLLSAVVLLLLRHPGTPENSQPAPTRVATNVQLTLTPSASPSAAGAPTPMLGEKILRDYAKPSLPPENDLTLVARLMENFTLVVKSAADRPLSANEDWATALRGNNPTHERFLPTNHIIFNSQGQLIDRWGTPLFFHALGAHRFELRSAGPDKQLWTADDLHRNYDGSFRRGTELNSPSLFDTALKPAR